MGQIAVQLRTTIKEYDIFLLGNFSRKNSKKY